MLLLHCYDYHLPKLFEANWQQTLSVFAYYTSISYYSLKWFCFISTNSRLVRKAVLYPLYI